MVFTIPMSDDHHRLIKFTMNQQLQWTWLVAMVKKRWSDARAEKQSCDDLRCIAMTCDGSFVIAMKLWPSKVDSICDEAIVAINIVICKGENVKVRCNDLATKLRKSVNVFFFSL